jgi:hypothetical protein
MSQKRSRKDRRRHQERQTAMMASFDALSEDELVALLEKPTEVDVRLDRAIQTLNEAKEIAKKYESEPIFSRAPKKKLV